MNRKKTLWNWFLVFVCTLSLGACATLEKDKVQTVGMDPVVSKTIQQSSSGMTPGGLKRIVAIGRFSNETRYGQSFFLDENDDRIGKQCVDILSAKLMDTDKFIVLERADIEKINSELSIGDTAEISNMADYLIIGSVTEFGRKDQSEVGIFSRVKKQVAFAKVHIRLIDVRTGQIVYAEEGTGEAFSEAGSIFGVGDKAGYDSTLNDKVLEAAITDLSSNIIENLLDKPWKSYILGYEDGLFIISGGESQNIKPGMTLFVEKEGRTVKNPQTNMDIKLPGKVVGEIVVEQTVAGSVENEISLCSIKTGNFSSNIKANDFSKLLIRETR